MSSRVRLMREQSGYGPFIGGSAPHESSSVCGPPPIGAKRLKQVSALAVSTLTGSVSVAGSMYSASLDENGMLALYDADKGRCVGEVRVPTDALDRLHLSASRGGLNNGSLLWLRRVCPDFATFIDAFEATPPSGCTSWLKSCAYPAALFWLLLCVFIAFGGEGLMAEEAAEAAAAAPRLIMPVDWDVSLARFRESPLGRLLLAKKQQLRRSVQSLASVRGFVNPDGGSQALTY